ncbi:sensor histidine kinase [Marinobacterium stanieri]|uniref:histidine kinase n=1 Tax=Marinobacterium stanieri TaxID=49186 RepID=A0A1N6U056_9GAMM|nr:sensor histidine kinase [Marinobacterium stanieri]SIQ59002.1 Signal transduction histidine kinase [Marinobacterium stanieri]
MKGFRCYPKLAISVIFLLFSLVLPQAQASFNGSDTYTPRFEYYVDSTQTLGIDSVANLPASAFKQAPKAGYVGGYNRSIQWLKFRLPPSSGPSLLRIKPAYTDYVTLYQPDDGDFKVTERGELSEVEVGRFDRAIVFELEPVESESTYYLRIETENTSTVVAQVYTQQGYLRAVMLDSMVAGSFIGLLITLIVVNLSYQRWRNDLGFRYYILFVIASLMVFLSVDGWLLLVSPQWLKPLVSYLPQLTTLLYLLSVAVFYQALFGFALAESRYCLWISRIYQLAILLGGGALIVGAYIEYFPWFMQISVIYLLWISMIALKRVWTGSSEGRALLFAVVLGFLGILGTALSLNGIVSGGIWLLYSYTAGTLASILVFQSVMNRRLRCAEKVHLTTLLEKEHAEVLAERERQEKELKAQFISMLSHELKTPLSVISMGVSQQVITGKTRKYLIQAVSDMSRVIDRCAVLEQVDAEVYTRKEAVELVNLIGTQIEQAGGNSRILWQPPQSELWVSSDTDWLRVIVSNLIDNALKYSPAKTAISVRVECHLGEVCVQVENMVEGEPPDPQYIFDKYYRARSAHKQTGAGLGLYIVKRLVAQLGARIDCRIESLPIQMANRVVMCLCLPDRQ